MKEIKKTWVPENLYLYVIVRQDLDSMGRGRTAAQASHAANQMTYEHHMLTEDPIKESYVMDWVKQTPYGFGTQIVKKVNSGEELTSLYEHLSSQNFSDIPVVIGLTIDPEYFVPDGESGHLVKDVPTALYCLLPKNHEITESIIRPIELLDNDPPVR